MYKNLKMNITIIGSGYVGLVTGTCLAETGNNVVCVDINEEKIQSLRSGVLPIYEPGLDTLFQRNIKLGRLQFTTDLKEGISNSGLVFLALPTPSNEDGSADLSYVKQVATSLAVNIENYTIVITKSTVPVGSGQVVENIIKGCLEESMFDVVSNPEFLREGSAVADFMKPDRIVIGTDSNKAKDILKQLYKPFVRENNGILFMDRKSAEVTKYAANSYLATRISFMNEIANLCELVGANVDCVRNGVGTDSRIGTRFLFPGIGYGGSCFPKDVRALTNTAENNGYKLNILEAVKEVNNKQKLIITKKLENYFDNRLKNKKIAIWGLAFKPNTDDIREAPALEIINFLQEKGCSISVYDPEAMINVRHLYKDTITYCSNQYDALAGADALIIATEWPTFKKPDFDLMLSKMNLPVVFDGRNTLDSKEIMSHGFYYNSIGKPSVDNLLNKNYNLKLVG